ncbi:DNA polymerase III subunit gamma/tau [Pedobacter sp.]|nr:DNA polymerase III subunit gamma/tau [Candidatus Saccharibacteria bacterium]
MARALYRQYRSKRFDEVVGQEHITDLLSEAIERKAISHAYLFTGPRGVGKTSVARILAHEINELPYSDTTHLDIIEIDAASNRRIDDIRDLREKVHIAPTSAKYKVYIIDEVHMLTGESFNALLKTLEEPPDHVIFILATTELHKVPATIVSRTQRFQFRPVVKEKAVKHLRSIADKEKIAVDDAALELIAEHGEGSLRDSISLLDQLSSMKSKSISADTVESLLGLAPYQQVVTILEAIAKQDETEAIATLKGLFDKGNSPQTITDQLLRGIPILAPKSPQLYDLMYELLDVPRSYAPQLKLLAVIARAAHKPRAPRVMPLEIARPAVISAPIVQKNTAKATPKAPTITVDEPTGEIEPVFSTDVIADFDWNIVLEKLQKHHPALHSVLKRADASYVGSKLILEFTYSLHRKKIQDSKYRSQLISLITDIFGSCPEIIVATKDANKPPTDKTAAAVAAIMGGGVQINV